MFLFSFCTEYKQVAVPKNNPEKKWDGVCKEGENVPSGKNHTRWRNAVEKLSDAEASDAAKPVARD